MRRDAPARHGSHKTLCNRFVRWSEAGVFNRIFQALAAESKAAGTVMIDATRLKAHRTARPACSRRGSFALHRAHPGRTDSKLHAVCDGKPLKLLLSEGQMSDCRGAEALLPVLPDADTPIGDKGHDSDCVCSAICIAATVIFRS